MSKSDDLNKMSLNCTTYSTTSLRSYGRSSISGTISDPCEHPLKPMFMVDFIGFLEIGSRDFKLARQLFLFVGSHQLLMTDDRPTHIRCVISAFLVLLDRVKFYIKSIPFVTSPVRFT